MQIIYRHTDYQDQFLVGGAPPLHISAAMRKALEVGGVGHVTDDDDAVLDDVLEQIGWDRSRLTPIGT